VLVYDTAQRVDELGEGSFACEASMAKLKSTEVQRQAALEGVQMLDGYGYASEYEME
jgi:alkylation response protein AidB-like acyl-CoA dehydrogenase